MKMHSKLSLLLDANLLVLLIVGRTDTALIARHKNLERFVAEDFEMLELILAEAAEVIVTPHCLAEASNLAGQIGDPNKTAIFETFRDLIAGWDEIGIGMHAAARNKSFVSFGMADAALLEIGTAGSRTFLTADVKLHAAMLFAGHESVNFNEYRPYA
jgi:predicted nucleic acid-binding protein